MTCATLSKDGSYQSLKRPYVKKHIDSSSTLYEVTGISPTLLSEIAPHFYQIKDIRDDTDCKMPKGVGRAPGLFF
ncbi:PREDICTED: pre-mRNA-splicing factor ATP-dependent RNA helicase DEAH1-like [Camelina sativa]|uniref:Pre-mRNA-splicing factor ATP-dependent RNA helicase DEAH1-like n=1 Tax=Camelina sativa TaxID=90675 RepID=A0ABM1R0T2_CAMSA|nr:PREDICTED: pre-mRNA-splicing factor ATP-dependent RNA helicase DEAH1-like [Camelina sativa]